MPSYARSPDWTWPPRARACWRASVPSAAECADLGAIVACGDAPHRARAGTHDERLGRGTGRALVADALKDIAVGDAGGGEEAVVALDEIVDGQDLLDFVA